MPNDFLDQKLKVVPVQFILVQDIVWQMLLWKRFLGIGFEKYIVIFGG